MPVLGRYEVSHGVPTAADPAVPPGELSDYDANPRTARTSAMPDDALQPPLVEPGVSLAVARVARRRRALVVGGVVLAVFALWELVTSFVAYTSDAYVRSDLISIAPQVTGRIISVPIQDNQTVHRGDLLVAIDPEPFQLALDAAQASVRQAAAQTLADQDSLHVADAQQQVADAGLAYAQETIHRVQTLESDSVASRAELDAANEALRHATGDVEAAKGGRAKAQQMLAADAAAQARAEVQLAIAQWRLDRTKILAPADGTINNLTLRVGDMARASEPLIGVVDAHAWRIIANYKQYFIAGFVVGGTAWVWLDSHPWHFYRGRIAGIGRGISRSPDAQTLLPYVAPTTDWIRLQRRFPVTVDLVDPPPDLRLLMGADARVLIFP
jgi:multidrug efflux system membrane fusion protein